MGPCRVSRTDCQVAEGVVRSPSPRRRHRVSATAPERSGALRGGPEPRGALRLWTRRRFSMNSLYHAVAEFMKREDGPTAVEYAVMLALIIVVCITAITTLGSNANKTF